MHPRIAELLTYVQLQRVALFDAVGFIPEPLRDRRIDADTWSVAEVLEHLYLVESGIAHLFTRTLERAKAAGLAPESDVGSVLATLDTLRLTDRSRRMNAPELVMPRGELTAAQGTVGLTESRQALIFALRAADGLALGQVTRVHPTVGPLNLYQWVLFVGQHEVRHAGQLQGLAGRLVP